MSFLIELSLRSGFSTADVSRIVSNAPKRYKVYEIAKRNGGTRTIAQPSRELKALQRILGDCVLSRFAVHRSAMAYEKGRSIHMNAAAHVGRRALLKMDFLSFFNSIKTTDFDNFVQSRNVGYDQEDRNILHQVLFWGKGSYVPICLSVGAPSSPMVSNILMRDIDERACAAAVDFDLAYTRYADDVTVSGETIEQLSAFEKHFRKIIASAPFPKLRFNNKKRGVYVRGQRQMVTGLVLTPPGHVSIGRERKRKISAMVHHASRGELNLRDLCELKGLLAFAYDCEPLFIDRLRRKYGTDVMEDVVRR